MAKELRNILVNRIHERELKRQAASRLSGRMIDIGCGDKPYEDTLASCVTEHIGVDHEATYHDKSRIDLIGTAYDIPAEDNSFDCAICTAVLEHLEEPELALRECQRVPKPGGVAIYTVPFIWHLHEELRDFYRFTKYGLAYLIEKVGAELVELRSLSGFWVTFGQMFVYRPYHFNRDPLRWLRIIDAVGLLLQVIAYGLNRLDRPEAWTWMYLIVVRKSSP